MVQGGASCGHRSKVLQMTSTDGVRIGYRVRPPSFLSLADFVTKVYVMQEKLELCLAEKVV